LVGNEEPSSSDVVRSNLEPDDIHVFNVTNAGLKFDAGGAYESIPPKMLAAALAGEFSRRVWLRLENRFDSAALPIVETYDLSFKVYCSEQLAMVDRLFVDRLARPDIRVTDVDLFLADAASHRADDYSSALANYALAILIKDGDPASEVRVGQQDYRQKFNASLRMLQDIDRPLARLVSALIRLSVNDFSAVAPTGLSALDKANANLLPMTRYHMEGSPILVREDPERATKMVGIVPVDNGSDSVMRWADRLSSIARWNDGVADSLRAETNSSACDPLDRIKVLALWAATTHRLGKVDESVEPLRALAANDSFGVWAAGLLEEREN
jgi:hypothetical protein